MGAGAAAGIAQLKSPSDDLKDVRNAGASRASLESRKQGVSALARHLNGQFRVIGFRKLKAYSIRIDSGFVRCVAF
jgi:hypothetical protein